MLLPGTLHVACAPSVFILQLIIAAGDGDVMAVVKPSLTGMCITLQ